jgi:hypothetical protein
LPALRLVRRSFSEAGSFLSAFGGQKAKVKGQKEKENKKREKS